MQMRGDCVLALAAGDRAVRRQTHGSYRRDEMKEHRRLQNAGVLNEKQFQAARGLILRAHG